MRWRTDGHMVLDDRSGASISCMGPVDAPNAEQVGAALAQRVAIVLNDAERKPSRLTEAAVRFRRTASWLAWPTVPTVVAVAVLLPEWRTRLAWLTAGAAVGVLGPLVWVWGARKDAEASHARTDVALEHVVVAAVDAQKADCLVDAMQRHITGELPVTVVAREASGEHPEPDPWAMDGSVEPGRYPARCDCGQRAVVFDEDGDTFCQACWDAFDPTYCPDEVEVPDG